MRWALIVLVVTTFNAIASAEEAPTKRLALVIGNSDYPVSPLVGPANDAENIKKLLVRNFLFQEEDVALLVNASKKQILDSFDSTLEQLQGVDPETSQLLFFYSGHGALVTDGSGGDEIDEILPDTVDEVFVGIPDEDNEDPIDHPAEEIIVRDDDFFRFLNQASQSVGSMIVIIDACHSGGLARGNDRPKRFSDTDLKKLIQRTGDTPEKYIPNIEQLSTNAGNAASAFAEFSNKTCKVLFIAACQPDQKASDGHLMSRFTRQLWQAFSFPKLAAEEVESEAFTFAAFAKYLEYYFSSGGQNPVMAAMNFDTNADLFESVFVIPEKTEPVEDPIKPDATDDNANRRRKHRAWLTWSLYTRDEVLRPIAHDPDQLLTTGDRFLLRVRAEQDLYLYVLAVDPDDGPFPLLPLSDEPDLLVPEQLTASIPNYLSAVGGDSFELTPPAGKETLRIIASLKPLDRAATLEMKPVQEVKVTSRDEIESVSPDVMATLKQHDGIECFSDSVTSLCFDIVISHREKTDAASR